MRRSSDRLIWSGLLLLSEALSFEVDAVCVVDEAIEDCVVASGCGIDGGFNDWFHQAHIREKNEAANWLPETSPTTNVLSPKSRCT
jgi:hypothetical protein